MIRHILSIVGCIAGIIVCIFSYFFAVRNNEYFAWAALGFAILTLLVYWNLKIELKKDT